jgi:acyl-CoA synthetase (NDP forming)
VSLDTLFDPASIAVVGASQTPSKIGYEAMKGIQAFSGSASPVNPNTEGEILGESDGALALDGLVTLTEAKHRDVRT